MTWVKGPKSYLDLGNWNVVCYFCGVKYKATDLKRYWQGFWVCESCWEPRQEQDFVRGVPDDQTPAWTQPKPPNVFVPLCTPNTITAYPGYAQPGCVMPGYIHPAFNPDII